MAINDAGIQAAAADNGLCLQVKEEGIVPIQAEVEAFIERLARGNGCIAERAFDRFSDWLNREGRFEINCNSNWRAFLWWRVRQFEIPSAAKWCKVHHRNTSTILPHDAHTYNDFEYQELIQHCLDKMDRKHRDAILLSWLRLENQEIAKILGRDAGDTARLRAQSLLLLGHCVQQQRDGGNSS